MFVNFGTKIVFNKSHRMGRMAFLAPLAFARLANQHPRHTISAEGRLLSRLTVTLCSCHSGPYMVTLREIKRHLTYVSLKIRDRKMHIERERERELEKNLT